jgi:hypothetical protein
MKETQQVTSYIKHLAVSGLMNVSARIKSICNLTGNRPQSATFHTAKRYHPIFIFKILGIFFKKSQKGYSLSRYLQKKYVYKFE